MSKIEEALEAWRRAVRDLDAAAPGEDEWKRARQEAETRREAYQTVAAESRRREGKRSDPSMSQETTKGAGV